MRRGSIWSHVTQDGDQASRYEPFVHGGLQGAGAWDRPVDMPVASEGSLLVRTTTRGAVYRVRYRGQ